MCLLAQSICFRCRNTLSPSKKRVGLLLKSCFVLRLSFSVSLTLNRLSFCLLSSLLYLTDSNLLLLLFCFSNLSGRWSLWGSGLFCLCFLSILFWSGSLCGLNELNAFLSLSIFDWIEGNVLLKLLGYGNESVLALDV